MAAVIVKLALAFLLMALCVVIHAFTILLTLRQVRGRLDAADAFSWTTLGLMVHIASNLTFAHLVEIVLWGYLYLLCGVFPDPETAHYFSAVTYTTVGYGDLVPPVEWRVLAAVEGLTGILMCGWSAGFFFATVGRLLRVTER